MHQHLRDDQIAATLRRHGYPETTDVLGVKYETGPGHPHATVSVVGARLIVPDDVWAMEAAESDQPRSVLLRD